MYHDCITAETIMEQKRKKRQLDLKTNNCKPLIHHKQVNLASGHEHKLILFIQ